MKKHLPSFIFLGISLVLFRLIFRVNFNPLFALIFLSTGNPILFSLVMLVNLGIDCYLALTSYSNLLIQVSVYAAYLIGYFISNPHKSISCFSIPTVHFVLTNFVCWLQMSDITSPWYFYPRTFQGLVWCYTASVPFYINSLFSTALFLVLFRVSSNIFKRTYSLSDSLPSLT